MLLIAVLFIAVLLTTLFTCSLFRWPCCLPHYSSVSLLPALSRLTEAERETIMTTRDRTEIVKILVDAGIVFGEQEETKETQD